MWNVFCDIYNGQKVKVELQKCEKFDHRYQWTDFYYLDSKTLGFSRSDWLWLTFQCCWIIGENKTREVSSGYWVLRPLQKRRHIRFSTVLYTKPAHEYQLIDPDDDTTQTSFFGLSSQRRNHLYRSYAEYKYRNHPKSMRYLGNADISGQP